jgi:protein-S-isoprenylcysteine O-methyltransferase Ste14
MKVKNKVRDLIGSGDRIVLFMVPFVVAGLILNVAFPGVFDVGGPPPLLRAVSIVVLFVGLVVWAWSVVLILARVPRGQLITTGPFAFVKHPLYTGVALLVLPWAGFLLDTWLGAAFGAVMYLATRIYAPAEEVELARQFGPAWDEYARTVTIHWL